MILLENNRPELLKALKAILVILILSLLICFCSCSCDYHLRKLQGKCGKFTSDTLIVYDTLITREVKHDTTFKYFQRDTVIVREGKLTMKYFYRNHDSTVYLQGRCAPDTIIRQIVVPYEKVNVEVSRFPTWLFWLLIGVLIAFGFLYLFYRLSR